MFRNALDGEATLEIADFPSPAAFGTGVQTGRFCPAISRRYSDCYSTAALKLSRFSNRAPHQSCAARFPNTEGRSQYRDD
jgi:hypothetical protein